MSDNSTGLAMVDLHNAIDSEFEVAKVASVCSRSTSLLFNRVDTLSGKQSELKNILESIDAQLRQADELQLRHNRLCSSEDVRSSPNTASPLVDKMARRSSSDNMSATQSIRSRSISTERRISGGGKDSPIVIEDEEEVFAITIAHGSQKRETVCASQNAVCHGSQKLSDKGSPHTVVTQQPLQPSAQEVILANVRRRPKIIEKTPKEILDDRDSGLVAVATLSPGSGNVCSSGVSENTLTTMTPSTSSPASFPVPMLISNGDNGSSTESASSSFNDRSQSPLEGDDFEPSQSDVVSASSSPVPSMGRMLRASSATPTITSRPHNPSDFKVGSRVLGKRSSDIWFPGEIIKVMQDKYKQTKYSIKYDKSQKGVLSLNHICPEAPATAEDLCVGSRVVGLYGRLDIWYAGIVAEMPCTDNRNRFLVFFDDGFAQYLSSKKMHKVHHKGKNVWEDVTIHSRDFIQEYLEDYPSRPMLHVRVGQWIRTEWMGQWLKAKVLSVDGSLAKMLFQVDNRSEWIYRGSTRLDPLYRALVMGEKTTSAKARSRKLTRNASSKGNTPYIEYNITKPSFGISPYSKTDPKGIQQLQLEEQRRITQLQQQPQQGSNHTKENVRSAEVIQPKSETATVVSMKSTSLAVPKEAAIFLPIRDPVIESTYSCIQASTLRKRTGVSLVSTSVFKPVEQDPVDNPTPVSTSLKPPYSNTTTTCTTHTNQKQNLKNVDQKKPKGKGSPWKAPWLNLGHRNKQRHDAENLVKPQQAALDNKPPDVAAILINKLDASTVDMKQTVASHTTSPSLKAESLRSISGPHTCSFTCSQHTSNISVDPLRHNPLAVPLLVDWKREIVKRRGKTNKRDVYYRTPCHRRLRNMAEVLQYLSVTQNRSLAVDLFTFEWRVRTKDMTQAHAFVKDISNGQENRPLPAVNEVDSSRTPDVQYVSHRQLAPEVKLSKDPGFMVSCDCVDCSDPATCACIQLTNQSCKAMDGKDNDRMTYQYKRLKDCIQTGIYECNANCSCSKNCLNRVVQNGIQMRMEVFKTENRGWGLRAVDDIPAGTFICTYSGYLLNEELANQDGSVNGDEYMAELDYIEVAEKAKEGYESGVSDLEEDDNVIHEMLQFDENLSGSENSVSYGDRSLCRDEDLEEVEEDDDEEEDEEEEEEEEDDEEEDEDEDDDNDAGSLSEDNCSLSSGNDSIFGQRRKTLRSSKRKKVFKNQQKKKRGTISEESLVVERESKANVLSRLADPLTCMLALKRNGNDLKKTLRFLRKIMLESQSMDTESIVLKEKHDQQVNGISDWEKEKSALLSNSDFDLDEMSDDALAAIHGIVVAPNSTTCERRKENEQKNIGGPGDGLSTHENKEKMATSMGALETAPANNMDVPAVEDIEVAKEHAPELLSADDLKRLAASQPKSIEPPVLSKAGETRRGTVLDETIEKLKKRVNPFEELLPNDVPERTGSMETGVELREGRLVGEHEIDASPEFIPRAKSTGDELGGSKISENLSNSEKTFEHDMAADDDKCSLQSEGSLHSRNSSSVSQSTSSRVSSPAEGVDNGSEKNSGKVKAKGSCKVDKSEENSLSVKHVKTRSFFGEEHCYVIDAKTFGNCGRFLNHSCSPNLFVQNVFVDTHDLRFPWVAFFAQHNIKAGAELSWDYMYEVGSVRDKVLHCLCGSSECRGRLL